MGAERGEVSVTDSHFEGDALNVAARIQALATPGGLSVSGGVYAELDEPALRFRPRGSRRLKNIPAPVEVYDFVDLPTHRPPEMASQLALEIPTVAVLPLHTEGVDPGVANLGLAVVARAIEQVVARVVLEHAEVRGEIHRICQEHQTGEPYAPALPGRPISLRVQQRPVCRYREAHT